MPNSSATEFDLILPQHSKCNNSITTFEYKSQTTSNTMVNRTALLLRYNKPAIQWINDADPVEDAIALTEKEVNMEHTVYLISGEDGENGETQQAWIKRNFRQLFESELEGWYTDPELWPKPLTLKLFHKWFDTEFNTMIIDTVDGPLFDDGF